MNSLSPSGPFLYRGAEKPFLMLADTAWELVHRLDFEEVRHYARIRAAQGFNTVLFCLLAELDGLHTPNRNGDIPLTGDDPCNPNEAYFEFVDQVLDVLDESGLVAGILPTWGDKWNLTHGVGPEIFTPANAQAYGEWLSRRYGKRSVVWVLGGDRAAETDLHRAIMDSMAVGIRSGCANRQLITFHPPGLQDGRTSLGDPDWLDATMRQSGHCHDCMPNYFSVEKDYRREPVKPVLDGEPCYEGHPVMSPNWQASEERHWAHHCRRAMYWAVFSGACGHVYGAHPVWQFYTPGRTPELNGARWSWREALQFPGATQIPFIHRLLPFEGTGQWFPAQELIVRQPPAECGHLVACRNSDRTCALVYTPDGSTLELDLAFLEGADFHAAWWQPATGTDIEKLKIPSGKVSLRPPAGGPDWVLRIWEL